MSAKGWVYVITNKAMPGLVKIGFSMKDPALRAIEFSGTGVPHPFVVEYSVLVPSPREIEQRAHSRLRALNEAKEWFRCAVTHAIDVVRETAGTRLLFEIEIEHAQVLTPEQRAVFEREVAERKLKEKIEREREYEAAQAIKAKFAARKNFSKK